MHLKAAWSHPSQESTQEESGLTPDKFIEKTGFKTLADAEKSIKEGQQKITKQGQEKSDLEAQLQAVYSQRQQPVQQSPPQGQGDFYDNPEQNVARISRNEARSEVQQALQTAQRDRDIAEVRAENPELFDMTKEYTRQKLVAKPWLDGTKEVL